MFTWEIVIALLIGFIVMTLVAKKPKLFWPILIIVNLVGNGPRLMGYYFWGELLTGAVVLGALMHIWVSSTHQQLNVNSQEPKLTFNLWTGFMVWVGYMIIESVIGVFVNEDWRIIRWILFYTLLGLLSFILYNKNREFPFPPMKKVFLIVLIPTIAYNIAYLAIGLTYERILGEYGRWSMQYLSEGWFLWSGSAAAAFPAFVAMPVAIMALEMSPVRIKTLAWVTIFIMLIVAFYYDIRSVIVVVLGCFLISLRKIKRRYIVVFLLIFSLVFVVFIDDPLKNVYDYYYHMYRSIQVLWNPDQSDMARKLQFNASLMRITDNMKTFLVGDGIYSHRYTIAPYISKLYDEHQGEIQIGIAPEGHNDPRGGIFRTTGFAALLIDTGIIGMVLFVFYTYFILSIKLIRRKCPYTTLFLMIIFLSFMFLFYINPTGVILLYLMIMPRGLIEQLHRSNLVIT